MDNLEKLATQGTQGDEKHRETGNIGYTRRRKTQRNWQHRVHKTTKNTEKLATQGTQDDEKQQKTQHNMCRTPIYVNKLILCTHSQTCVNRTYCVPAFLFGIDRCSIYTGLINRHFLHWLIKKNEKKKCHIAGAVSKSNRQTVERDKTNTFNTYCPCLVQALQ